MPSKQELQQRLVWGALAMQVALLLAWSVQEPFLLAALIGLGGALLWAVPVGLRRVGGAPPWVPMTSGHVFSQLALGGLGMLLGAWADAHFQTPHCLCCSWGPHVPFFTAAYAALCTWSAAGMALGCALTVFVAPSKHTMPMTAKRIAWCMVEFLAMLVGMVLAMPVASSFLRLMPWWKLVVGHSFMMISMGLAAAIVCNCVMWSTSSQRGPQSAYGYSDKT